jgi:hypothetical protein
MYSSTHSLISALGGGEWSASRPGRFTPRERASGTPWIGSCVVPKRTVLITNNASFGVLFLVIHIFTPGHGVNFSLGLYFMQINSEP